VIHATVALDLPGYRFAEPPINPPPGSHPLLHVIGNATKQGNGTRYEHLLTLLESSTYKYTHPHMFTHKAETNISMLATPYL